MLIKNCRLCRSGRISKIVDLGYHPLADTFLPPEVLYSAGEMSYPLHLGLCQDCGHVFTLFAVAPEERYQKTDYSYDSSNSAVSIGHFKEFAEAVIAEKAPGKDGLIVDIGSNVGTLLSHFRDHGHPNIIGVEPSRNIAELAITKGVPTINDFFCKNVIEPLRKAGPAKIVVSANVVNHADELGALLNTVKGVLAEGGIFVFEVPYLLDLLKNTAFDTIYHEHVHYHSLRPLSAELAREGFSVFKVERTDYMCGSIRVYARVGGTHSALVDAMIEEEIAFGLFEPATWATFSERILKVKTSMLSYMAKIRAKGGKVIGIGAATKGNTLLNYCRLDGDSIAYIADSSPLKIGKLTPGSHIPIVSDFDIDSSVTHAIILPWNIAPMLKSKLAHLGLNFYVPQVETLSSINS